MATLGFAEIVRMFAINLPRVTNGALGFKGIPDYANLWWNFGWCVFTLVFLIRLIRSNSGNVFKAIRDDETAAKAMGVDVFRVEAAVLHHRVVLRRGGRGAAGEPASPRSTRRCSPSS